MSSEQISQQLNLPLRIVRDVIFELEQAGLIHQVKSDENDKVTYYAPARDVHNITIYDVITTVERHGEESVDILDSEEVRAVSAQLDAIINEAMQSPNNLPFTKIN